VGSKVEIPVELLVFRQYTAAFATLQSSKTLPIRANILCIQRLTCKYYLHGAKQK
jgi:hypothetical protein